MRDSDLQDQNKSYSQFKDYLNVGCTSKSKGKVNSLNSCLCLSLHIRRNEAVQFVTATLTNSNTSPHHNANNKSTNKHPSLTALINSPPPLVIPTQNITQSPRSFHMHPGISMFVAVHHMHQILLLPLNNT